MLQIADLHLTPRNHQRVAWVSRLAGLEPDLVIDTGDNLSHPDAVPVVTKALGRLLDKPGVFVWGSNDYYAPTFKNPLTYLTRPSRMGRAHPVELPWRDLGAAFERRRLGRSHPPPADAGDQRHPARLPRRRRRPPGAGRVRPGGRARSTTTPRETSSSG